MRIDTLGGLAVRDDNGRPVDLGGPKQRTVLAALVLARGRPVTPDRLKDHVWHDHVPANPDTSLQAYISNLRRALEPNRRPRDPATLLVTTPAGYALAVDRTAVDLTVIEDLVVAARQADQAGDRQKARAQLDDALARCVGPLLPELAGVPWVDEVSGWMEALRLQALELRFTCGLQLGEHVALLPRLEQAVIEHPFHERFRAQLALALYRAGRQRDALAALSEARTALVEQVGIEPGVELRRLEQDILSQAPSLDVAAVLAAPVDETPASTATPDPVTPAPRATKDNGFVGRDRELDVLVRAAEQSAAGAGRPVVIGGEPGIGKTRLVEELIGKLPPSTVVAWGRCPEHSTSSTYWPIVQIARQLDGAGVLSAELVPMLYPDGEQPGFGADDPTAEPFAQQAAAIGVLASSPRPLVVVVDDVQWADISSLRLLEFLAGELQSMAVLLVVTIRSVGVGEPPRALLGCLGEMARQPGAVRIELDGLDDGDVAKWLARHSVTPVDPRLTRLVTDRTAGNPFFVGELVRLLDTDGRPTDVDVLRRASAVPAAVQDVVRRRLGRLPSDTQQMLATASVIGRTFDLDVLAAVLGEPAVSMLELLEPAVDAGLVDNSDVPGRFEFSHALIAETLSVELSAVRRARLHAATARAIAALRVADVEGNLDALTFHAIEGAIAGTAAEAYDWSVQAARLAGQRHAHEDAAVQWSRAARAAELDRPTDLRPRIEALVEEGEAWLRVDDVAAGYRALETAIGLARSLGDADLLARSIAATNIDGMWPSAEVILTDVDIIGALEAGLAALPDEPRLEQARVIGLGAMAEAAYWRRPAEWIDRVTADGVARARRLGDPVVLGRALHQRNLSLWRPATFGERVSAATEFLSIAETNDVPPMIEALAHFGMAGIDYERGHVPAAAARVEIVEQMAQRIGSPGLITQQASLGSAIAAFRGDLRRAEELLEPVHEIYRRSRRWAADMIYAASWIPIWAERGRLDLIHEIVDRMQLVSLNRWFRECIALAHVYNGDLVTAAAIARDEPRPRLTAWTFLASMASAARVRVAIGSLDRAAEYADAIRPFAGVLAASANGAAFGDIHLALADVAHAQGDGELARHHIEASIALLTAADSGPDLVRALLLRAEINPERSDADRTRARLLARERDLTLLRSQLD